MSDSTKEINSTSEPVTKPMLGAVALTEAEIESIIEAEEEEDMWNDDDWDDYFDSEPDGYECMGCGNIQGRANGFGCDKCGGAMREWRM